ncbi:D-2-hydroxyacid dehydrogenase [Pseudactinotalea sp. Z1739]|uniref:D-2-hydroxyacid dehydrogenase n=1 Tax=Pseudactinotalea sp. Z1739 TaxID=3413028 RepID=UPI003C7B032E
MSGSVPAIAVLLDSEGSRPPGLKALEGRAQVRYADADSLGEAVQGAQALFLWDFFSTAVRDVWDRCGDLDWIHVAAAGVDTLLFDELRESDVMVTNARGVFDQPIAEFVLASVLAHAKLLHESAQFQAERTWVHRETTRVAGKNALVVGTGAIGRACARLLGAVGMTVHGAGRTARAGDADFAGIHASADLPAYVGWADYVINAAPLTRATTGLFDAPVFAAMRPGAHFINIGRGASVVEDDLLTVVCQGPLDGASLDVFGTEPLPAEHPLWDAPGVRISAHMSGDVVGWRDELAAQFLDNAERWLAGQDPVNVVDKSAGFVR